VVCSFRGVATAIVSIGLMTIGAKPAVASHRPFENPAGRAEQAASKPTADQQSNDKSDVGITKEIRHAITSDKTLSTSAHNVKVITERGHVTLRGPVRSESEKQQIEAKAIAVAGAANVQNEISVGTPTTKANKSKH
jgi:hyperosmotically inducible protein